MSSIDSYLVLNEALHAGGIEVPPHFREVRNNTNSALFDIPHATTHKVDLEMVIKFNVDHFGIQTVVKYVLWKRLIETTNMRHVVAVRDYFDKMDMLALIYYAFVNDWIPIRELFFNEEDMEESRDEGDTNWFKRHGIPSYVSVRSGTEHNVVVT